MDPKYELSEKLRKYLIEFKYQHQTYYTVLGADLTNPLEEENLLVDENKKLVLFKEVALIRQSIEDRLFLFDPERLIPWGAAMDPGMDSYEIFDLDILMSDDVHQSNDPVLEEINFVLDVVEDYARQVEDDILLGYLESDLFQSFKNIADDCYLWGQKEVFDEDFDYDTFRSRMHDCYNYLKNRIRIY